MANAPLKFVRDSAREAKWLAQDHSDEIAQSGMTPEQYLASRGGINENGQWGDTFIEGFTGQPKDVQLKYIADNNAFTSLGENQYGTFFAGKTAAGTMAQTDASGVLQAIKSKWPSDPLGASNRLAELANKANSGAPRPAPDSAYRGIEIIGSLSPAEAAEYAYLRDNVNKFIKSGPTVYGKTLPDGTIVNTYNPSEAGGSDVQNYINLFGNAGGTKFTASDGTSFNNQTDYQLYQSNLDAKKQQRVSAYNVLYNEFNKYGLGSLVSDIKNYLIDNTFDPSEFSIQLQNTDAYKKRFAANQDRINKGLAALTPAQYIALEDQYQEVMRRYGLPASYYSKGDLGVQEGFNKLISNDVSATELEDRVMTAQNRLINTDVNTLNALRQFYPNITNGDLLAYTLDPSNAINDIKRKATAAEIGGAALGQGLMADVNTAETLAKYGINKAQAQQGYSTIGQILPTASQLGDIYAKQGLGPYTQGTAEAEIFNTANAAEAARKRRRLAELEQATFGGSAGTSGNALNRDRAMTNQMLGTPGAGQF